MDKILKFIKDKGKDIYDIPLKNYEYKETCLELAKEEPAELIQAVTKMKRLDTRKKSTLRNILTEIKITINKIILFSDKNNIKELEKKQEEITDLEEDFRDNLCEEMADVINILIMLFAMYSINEDEVLKWLNKKYERMFKRIEEGDFY